MLTTFYSWDIVPVAGVPPPTTGFLRVNPALTELAVAFVDSNQNDQAAVWLAVDVGWYITVASPVVDPPTASFVVIRADQAQAAWRSFGVLRTDAGPAPADFTIGVVTVAEPAQVYVDVADVLERLRLDAGHRDAGYIADCTAAANELVDEYLRPADPVSGVRPAPLTPIPSPVWRAALGAAIRIYRFKDAESDVADTWGDTGQLRIPRDPLAGYREMLDPYRPGWAWAPA